MNLSLQHSLWPEKRGGENNKQPAMAAMSSFPQSKYILAYKFRSNEKKAIFIINNTIRRPDFLIRNLVKRLGYCMWMVTLRSVSMHPHNIAYQHSFLLLFFFTSSCHLLMVQILWNLLHLFPLPSPQIAGILGVSHMATSSSLKLLLLYLLPGVIF